VQTSQGAGMSAPLLVELFTEELPPKALKRLGAAFADGLLHSLRAQNLAPAAATVEAFSTPRRLAARISTVAESAADRAESKKLMPSKVAFGADGAPSPALMKRLEKEGAAVGQLQRKDEGGAEYVFLQQTVTGVSLTAGLQIALADTVAKLPVPKVMSYQLADGETTVQFVRPAHGLIALHGDQIVDVSILGLKADRVAHGHRFQGVQDIAIENAAIYDDALYTHGRVIASFEIRRSETERQLRKRAGELNASLGPEADVETLLDEVTALVEHPTVYVGEFEPEYLKVPPECLILTMRANQKYFPLFDGAGKLTNKFLIVSNMRLTDPAHIIEGNQRVVRPRLADARFFFETDRKSKLEDRVPQLATVTYHNKLGSQLDRVKRLTLLSAQIARTLAGEGYKNASEAKAERAAHLAKADLLTNMVGEFPELQGVMGTYYARFEGEDEEVARAIQQHYYPRFAGDSLPESVTGIVVALADRLDTLFGMFGIRAIPTGDKDPFALRRAALGVVRLLVEKELPLDMSTLFGAAESGLFGRIEPGTDKLVLEFLLDRMRSYLRDQGYEVNEIEAVLAHSPARLNNEIIERLQAVRKFRTLPEADGLAAANKRINNILKQDGLQLPFHEDLMREPAEQALWAAMEKARPLAKQQFETRDYAGTMVTISTATSSAVTDFFDQVLVMDKEDRIRGNRLALLRDLRGMMNQVADISKLAS
jgi:glycyl-tRNA synthetase beta chain